MSQQKYHQEFKPPPDGSVTGVQGQEQVILVFFLIGSIQDIDSSGSDML